ncbi:hypothetical protein ACLF3G_27440 [Falsiroseomonas sp. HC035]|uniref:hypothetical protein n=1 Tax=Falsiroseomonas sp. HC035 TaxID=3390999 RepID=UPI003D31197E
MTARRSAVAIGVALALPPLAWFAFQQGLGFALRLACGTGGPPVGPLAGGVALALCAAAGWIAWPASRGSAEAEETPRLLARIALGVAPVFSLAILLQALATLIEPPCWR